MTIAERFLSATEEKQIISAIKNAEKNTSGEVRVHIDESSGGNAIKRAKQAFASLEMDRTKDRNGVLFYISVEDNTFTIWGDKGIHLATPIGFWKDIKDIVVEHFHRQEFVDGLVIGIKMAGESLKEYFPYQSDDVNELPDKITYGRSE